MTLPTNYTDATTSATTHAAAHNDVNTQVNTNVTQLTAIDARYRQIARTAVKAVAANVTGAAVHAIQTNGVINTQSTNGLTPFTIDFDPADYVISGRATKLRIVVAAGVNDTAPGATFTFGLYPVGAPSGGINIWNPNFGTVVSGSTVAPTIPAVNLKGLTANSGDFDAPIAGWYALGVNISGAMTANSVVDFPLRLEIRNV